MGPIPELARPLHLEGSRRPPGPHEAPVVAFARLLHVDLVISEKLDGVAASVEFADTGAPILQAGGRPLARTKPAYAPFADWVTRHRDALHAVLGTRYVMFGEWSYAKRTIFYDALPHWFVEVDVYDRERVAFLSTARRRELLAPAPVVSVPLLHTGRVRTIKALQAMATRSLFKTERWRDALRKAAAAEGLDVDRVQLETDPSDDAEGIYVKVEDEDTVVDRLQFVRASFRSAVIDPDAWLDRPLVINALADGVDPLGDAR